MKTYLFDFDGTLVDSMPTYIAAMLSLLDDNNIKYDSDIVKVITPLGVDATAEYYIKMGLNLPKDKIVFLMKEHMKDAYLHTIQAKSNVINVLKELKDRGASLNVLTASPHITLDACLKRLGIYHWFDNVWSCSDFETTKSDPNIYKKVATVLGKNIDEILFLDDNLNADQVAKTAGMKVCGVYDDSSKEYQDEIKSVADFYIYDFSELLGLF